MTPSRTQLTIGWILTVLVALMLLGPSAMGKFLEWEGKADAFAKMGFTTNLMFGIGILEVTLALMYLLPRTAFLGAILLTGYLGGATVTHLRINEPYSMAIVIGVVMWVGLALRRPEIFRLAFTSGRSTN